MLRAGPRALAQLRTQGLRPQDVGCVPAAAGGPKGLALIPLDRRLFGAGGWLRAQPLDLIGASIGAWRMFAAARMDADAALDALAEAYIAQHYDARPTTTEVSAQCRLLARAVLHPAASADGSRLDDGLPARRAGVSVQVITARAQGVLAARRSRAAFARVALSNLRGRSHLARHLARVVFAAGAPRWPQRPFDAFGLTTVPLDAANAEDALLASGSIPLLCDPVAAPAGAPPGDYWDGGLIDYHLHLPYDTADQLVLYPHFAPRITPGWLDKHLPWRRTARGHWLDNVLLIAPAPALLARLPNGKLPDRSDFHRYGRDHAARQRDWRRALAECERLADEVTAWLVQPDPSLVVPL